MDQHRHLDDELSSLRDRVLLLGGEAEQALERAMYALCERDSDVASVVGYALQYRRHLGN